MNEAMLRIAPFRPESEWKVAEFSVLSSCYNLHMNMMRQTRDIRYHSWSSTSDRYTCMPVIYYMIVGSFLSKSELGIWGLGKPVSGLCKLTCHGECMRGFF